MGFKGENIRKLIQETHVRVELDTKNKEDRERTIDLYGEQSEIEAAMTAIQKHVDESGPCPQDEGVFHVSVPKREVGRLIGNKGERLRWIAERSSAKCHIVFDEHDDATAVCSGGLVEAEFARHLVQVILRVIDSEIPFQMTDLGEFCIQFYKSLNRFLFRQLIESRQTRTQTSFQLLPEPPTKRTNLPFEQ